MKANAPEKIYLDPKKVEESEFGIIDAIVPEYRVEKGDIEYTRTDAFIERACYWLSNISLEDMEYKYGDFDTSEGWYKMIEDFRKYMRGE